MTDSIYIKEPLEVIDGIPIFSSSNNYIRNYEQISNDHLHAISQEKIENPFISSDNWITIENSTLELINKYGKPGQRILDVGVGLGRLLSQVKDLKCYGIDISLNYLRQATQKGINVCLSMIEDLPYKADIFDIIVCTDVLEHVINLNDCCEKIFFSLKPGGYLIIRVPYKEDLASYMPEVCNYEFVHLRNFDEYSLRLLFEKIFPYKVIETSYVLYEQRLQRFKYNFPFFSWFTFKLLSLLRRVNFSAYEKIKRKLFLPVEINIVIQKD